MVTHVSSNAAQHIALPIRRIAEELSEDDPLRLHLRPGAADAPSLEEIARAFDAEDLPLRVDDAQVLGDWYAPDEQPPATSPTWYPAGALLARPGAHLAPGADALVLVPMDYVWVPVSTSGIYTYAHGAGLLRGERWTFVARPVAGGPQPAPMAVEFHGELPPERIEAEFGRGAARRARPDRPAVLVRVVSA